jgi:hypothetical protein
LANNQLNMPSLLCLYRLSVKRAGRLPKLRLLRAHSGLAARTNYWTLPVSPTLTAVEKHRSSTNASWVAPDALLRVLHKDLLRAALLKPSFVSPSLAKSLVFSSSSSARLSITLFDAAHREDKQHLKV